MCLCLVLILALAIVLSAVVIEVSKSQKVLGDFIYMGEKQSKVSVIVASFDTVSSPFLLSIVL